MPDLNLFNSLPLTPHTPSPLPSSNVSFLTAFNISSLLHSSSFTNPNIPSLQEHTAHTLPLPQSVIPSETSIHIEEPKPFQTICKSLEEAYTLLGLENTSQNIEDTFKKTLNLVDKLFDLCSSEDFTNKNIDLDENSSFIFSEKVEHKNEVIQSIQKLTLNVLGFKLGLLVLTRAGFCKKAKDCPPFTLLNAIHIITALLVRCGANELSLNTNQHPLFEKVLHSGHNCLAVNRIKLLEAFFHIKDSKQKNSDTHLLNNLKSIQEKLEKEFSPDHLLTDTEAINKKMCLRDLILLQILLSETFLDEDPFFNAEHVTPMFAEWFAKYVSYGDYTEGNLIQYKNNIFEVKKDVRFYESHGVSQGVRMFISELREITEKTPNSLHVMSFRGTCPESFEHGSRETFKRDLETTGIGKESFEKVEEELFNEFNDCFQNWVNNNLQSKKKFNLFITGHSLGGCDSQRFLNVLVRKIAEGKLENSKKLGKIQIDVQNSPHVEEKITDEFNKNLKKIKKLPITINYHHFKDDAIQTFGHPLVSSSSLLPHLRLKVYSYEQATDLGFLKIAPKARKDNHSATFYSKKIPQSIGKPIVKSSGKASPLILEKEDALQFLQQSLSSLNNVAYVVKILAGNILAYIPSTRKEVLEHEKKLHAHFIKQLKFS